jgi:PHP family Zn ribbon phosphoesterase
MIFSQNKGKEMKIEILPNYSAEKFYVLSELEQKCNFLYLNPLSEEENENAQFNNTTQVSVNAIMTFLYVIWSGSKHEELISSLQQYIQAFRNSTSQDVDISSCCVIIDILVGKEEFYSAKFQSFLFQTIEQIHQRIQIKFVTFAITDHSASLPGLEKCHDLIERILPGYSSLEKIANLITDNPMTLLGHDHTHEPDAVSGIFQALCYNDDDENSFLLTVFEDKNPKLKKLLKFDKKSQDRDELLSEETGPPQTGRSNNPTKERELSQWLFCLEATGCLIVAMIVYYFLFKK